MRKDARRRKFRVARQAHSANATAVFNYYLMATAARKTIWYRKEIRDDCPLVVDLDGTLIRTDMLYESVCKLFRESPATLCLIPFWLLQGKAR